MDVEGQCFKPHDKIPNGVILKYNKCHVTLEEIVLVFLPLSIGNKAVDHHGVFRRWLCFRSCK